MIARIGHWYRGWTMIGLGIVMVMLSIGTVTYGFSIYVTPVSDDLGLSRATMNMGIICQHVGTALLTPFIGWLLDRFSVRTIVLFSAFALGGSLVALSVGDALLPKALILVFPLSFGFIGTGILASYVLVARWFRLNLGRAMALVALGQSGSSIVVAPLIASLIEECGWRGALMIQGSVVCMMMLIISRLIVDRPSVDDQEPRRPVSVAVTPHHSTPIDGVPLTFRQLLTRPIFWLTALVAALTLSVVQAMLSSLVPLATGLGLSLVQGTTLLSMLGLSAVIGKVLLAVIADRIDRVTLLIFGIALIGFFTATLSMAASYYELLIACLFCGMGVGGFFPVYCSLLADRFGAASLGTSEGLVAPMTAIMAAGAIFFAGQSFDATGDYKLTFVTFTALLGLAMLLALSLRFVGSGSRAAVSLQG